jgi:hypothetical protein
MQIAMRADPLREGSRCTRFPALHPVSFVAGFAALAIAMFDPARASADETPNRVRAATVDPSATDYPVSPARSAMQFEVHGNSETDVGYAKYTFSDPNYNNEEFFDFRGRFVLGADVDHGFADNYFFHGRGQYVLWLREQPLQYQVNADDVYIQVGERGIWDFLIGRFMTWRVYRKGLGYDLYTLEDTGALAVNSSLNVTASSYGPHLYEVDEIYLRSTQGRAGLHLYPSSWSGLELVGQYGRNGTANSIGARAAGKVEYGPVSIAVGAEAKHAQPAIENPACDMCGVVNTGGFGGGLVLDLHIVELGANAAIEHSSLYGLTDGTFDKSSSGKRTSFGGYLELDPGSLLINRSLIIGAGLNQTETLVEAGDEQKHVQSAAYVAFPLGFNDGVVKFVLSKADLTISPRNNVEERISHMYAARLRVAVYF